MSIHPQSVVLFLPYSRTSAGKPSEWKAGHIKQIIPMLVRVPHLHWLKHVSRTSVRKHIFVDPTTHYSFSNWRRTPERTRSSWVFGSAAQNNSYDALRLKVVLLTNVLSSSLSVLDPATTAASSASSSSAWSLPLTSGGLEFWASFAVSFVWELCS